MRTRTIQPRVRTRTTTVVDHDAQLTLFENKYVDTKADFSKPNPTETPHTIMQNVLYNKIPGMFSRVADSGNRYFMYKNHIYLRNEKLSTDKVWAGSSPDKSTTLVNVMVSKDECHRLSKQNPLVALYDFLLQGSNYRNRAMDVTITLYKIEILLRYEVNETEQD